MDSYSKRIEALSLEHRKLLELRMQKKKPCSLERSELAQQRTEVVGDAVEKEGTDIPQASNAELRKEMQFSIFYFSDDGSNATDNKYQLLLESAKFADQHGFSAIWVPERHFQDFGGLYPNPTVLGAALAMVTERVQIRAGSIVLPLHNPIRVAEDWAVIDNLSKGRAAISFASGWHPGDFVLAAGAYEERKEIMFQGIETIQKLWRGEALELQDALGNQVTIRIVPRPLQSRLPTWITTSGNPATWIKAGEIGAHVLGALIGQTFDELARKIALYREARARHAHDPEEGRVTVMLHTFIGEDNDVVREQVRDPLRDYIATFIRQHENATYRQEDVENAQSTGKTLRDELLDFAFERYFVSNSLLGTPSKCARLIEHLQIIGVDEVACLIDFGLDIAAVMQGLQRLNALKERYHGRPNDSATGSEADM